RDVWIAARLHADGQIGHLRSAGRRAGRAPADVEPGGPTGWRNPFAPRFHGPRTSVHVPVAGGHHRLVAWASRPVRARVCILTRSASEGMRLQVVACASGLLVGEPDARNASPKFNEVGDHWSDTELPRASSNWRIDLWKSSDRWT